MDQSYANAAEGAMPTHIETAMAVLFTAFASDGLNQSKIEQTSFWDHDHVSRAQRDVAFEVVAGFVGLVIEHKDRFVAARHAASDLDAAFCSIGTHTAGKSNRLHQGRRLPDDVGSGPDDLAGDKNLRLQVVLGDVLWSIRHGNGDIEMIILVIGLQLGFQDIFERLLASVRAPGCVPPAGRQFLHWGQQPHSDQALGLAGPKCLELSPDLQGLGMGSGNPDAQAKQNHKDPHI